jgi:formylglycine-generating enzyme required for sulfatase activity
MTEFNRPTPEDEAFNDIERLSKAKQEIVKAQLKNQKPVAWGVFEGNLHDMFFTQEEAQEMAKLKGTHAEVRPLSVRNDTIEEVALHIEKLKGFGKDTTDSLAVYIREMKK